MLLLHLLPIPARPYLHWSGGLSNHFRSRPYPDLLSLVHVAIPLFALSDPATSFIAVFICGLDRTPMLDLSVTVWLSSEVT